MIIHDQKVNDLEDDDDVNIIYHSVEAPHIRLVNVSLSLGHYLKRYFLVNKDILERGYAQSYDNCCVESLS